MIIIVNIIFVNYCPVIFIKSNRSTVTKETQFCIDNNISKSLTISTQGSRRRQCIHISYDLRTSLSPQRIFISYYKCLVLDS